MTVNAFSHSASIDRTDRESSADAINFNVLDHTAQFYESETSLVDTVTTFLADGLKAGQPVLVIATAAHSAALLSRLRDNGFDTDELSRNATLILRDAGEMLSAFMVERRPAAEKFKAEIGTIIQARTRSRADVAVRVYGEMVDVLWRDGNHEAAIRVEELWNELAADHAFSLLCGYSMGSFCSEAHLPQFQQVCDRHSRVVPTERYMRAPDEGARLREVSLLQQRALALETELEHRREREEALRQALSDRERAEAERERLLMLEHSARADAEAASRLKDEFLAVLSHELRTPLNAILGWTHIATDSRSDEGIVRRALTVIQRNARLQLRVIDDLLDASRIVTGKLRLNVEAVDPEQVVKAALDSVRPAADARGLELRLHVDEAVGLVTGDFARLQQAVWNLLSNAIKFTPEGGTVEVRLDRVGHHAHIVVRDTGPGIAPDFLPHVFDQFRQADTGTARNHGGLGLGLAIVQYLAEAHGGTVAVKTAGEGSGATFTLDLPLRRTPAVAASTSPSGQTVALQHARVLIVDDDADHRELFEYALVQAGAKVEATASAAEALQLLSSTRFDVLIGDVGMPEADGYVLIRALRKDADPWVSGIPAVAVTSYAGDDYRAEAITAGYDEYVAKPLEPDRLAAIVSQLVSRRRQEPAT